MLLKTRNSSQVTKNRRVSAAARHASPLLAPVVLSDYLQQLNIDKGQRCVPLCRVSKEQQRLHLEDQRSAIVDAVETQGGVIVESNFNHVGSGGRWPYVESWHDMVSEATLFAKQHNAILVLLSPCRLIRSGFWNTHKRGVRSLELESGKMLNGREDRRFFNNEQQALVRDLEYLRDHVLFGIEVQTLTHPDASLSEIRSQHTKQGKAGRPCKHDSQKLKNRILWYWNGGYRNQSEIAQLVGVTKTTVGRHLKGLKSKCT